MSSDLPTNQPTASAAGPVGLIGLGLLGSALAQRLLDAGVAVVGFDLEAGRRLALQESGGHPLGSAQEVARACRRLFLALLHDGVCREVLQDLAPALAPGTVVLDATTGDPDAMAALGQKLAEAGVIYLDATVSGSSEQARQGEALFMVGGPKESFDQCQDLFRILARQAIYAGPCGSGAKLKLVTNLVLGLNRAALAEGLALAGALGLEAGPTLNILKASLAYSRVMDTKGEKMIRGEFEPQARLSQHLKDVRLMLEAAARAGQRLPLSQAHRELLEFAEQLGLGPLDNSAVLRAIQAQK